MIIQLNSNTYIQRVGKVFINYSDSIHTEDGRGMEGVVISVRWVKWYV